MSRRSVGTKHTGFSRHTAAAAATLSPPGPQHGCTLLSTVHLLCPRAPITYSCRYELQDQITGADPCVALASAAVVRLAPAAALSSRPSVRRVWVAVRQVDGVDGRQRLCVEVELKRRQVLPKLIHGGGPDDGAADIPARAGYRQARRQEGGRTGGRVGEAGRELRRGGAAGAAPIARRTSATCTTPAPAGPGSGPWTQRARHTLLPPPVTWGSGNAAETRGTRVCGGQEERQGARRVCMLHTARHCST